MPKLAILSWPALLLLAACGPPPVVPRTPPRAPPPRIDAAAIDSAPASQLPALPSSIDGREAATPPVDAWEAPDARAPDVREAPDVRAPDGRPIDVRSADALAPADASGARAPRPGEVMIVELLVNPAGTDLGREWIEVASAAREPLDLSDLYLADAAGDVACPAGVLAPGGSLVIAQVADPAQNGGVAVAGAYGTRLALNNDDEQLAICLGSCAEGVVLDRIGWPALGRAYDGHAVVVEPGSRRLCPAAAPFGSGGDFGTPGAPNAPCDAADGGTSDAARTVGPAPAE